MDELLIAPNSRVWAPRTFPEFGYSKHPMAVRDTAVDMYRGALSRDLPAFRGKPCPIPNLKPVK